MARTCTIVIFLVLLPFVALSAEVKLPSLFMDGLVLQQQTEAPIWGWAEPGEQVTVSGSWDSKKVSATAGDNGRWEARLPTPEAGGPFKLTINDKVLENILIGEVWICSGQSNMQWSLEESNNPEAEVAAANFPKIRLFDVAREYDDKPRTDCKANWMICTPENTKTFSAVAYYFGRKLHQELDIPVGLLLTCWGGTRAEAWTSNEALEADDRFAPLLERFAKRIEEAEPGTNPRNANSPSSLFNAMIAPLIPYAVRGAIWYQGEANVEEALLYEALFPAMIGNWRNLWKQGDFSFYFVQLAPYEYSTPVVGATLRDAQRKSLSVPNTGMAVTLDIGNPGDIHPRNKLDVGQRLARWALAKDYGRKELVYSGPLYRSMQVDEARIRIAFDHVGGGLEARGGALTDFEIAGAGLLFVPAKATIDGDTVVVHSPDVAEPKAVRFGFTNSAEPNLFNREGLPASSFRTDTDPIVTEKVLITGEYDPEKDAHVVSMECALNDLQIRYKTNGVDPDAESRPYTKPFLLKGTAQVRARAFDGDTPSMTVSGFDVVRHRALGCAPVLVNAPNERYAAGGNVSLVDGIRGSTDFRDGAWLGFDGNDLEAVIDLGENKGFRRITLGCMHAPSSWIFLPRTVEFAASLDGMVFKTFAAVENPLSDELSGKVIHDFEVMNSGVKARYLRIRAKNIGTCPEGHAGEGKAAWIFADEVRME